MMSAKLFEPPPKTYLIGHLAREFGVTARTLRYYEELGLLAPDRRDGARRYSLKDRDRLTFILRGRAVGLPLEEVGHLLDLHERGPTAAQLDVDTLAFFRGQLRRLEARREAVDQGIALLRSAIDQLPAAEGVRLPARSELSADATPKRRGRRPRPSGDLGLQAEPVVAAGAPVRAARGATHGG